jgi:ribonuclease D
VVPSEAAPDDPGPIQPENPPIENLERPRDGVPPVTETSDQLVRVTETFAAGTGPVAVDAERASGHRYGQRAFLVQLRREGAGTALIDPEALPDLSSLGRAIQDAEWIVHAATQDLPCLAELGMVPTLLFDTELGGRLAGLPRVGLAAMVEELLGLRLAKEHSAVDWSTRPLPQPWLVYAALDVEVLVDLRDAIAQRLDEQGKLEWARQDFAAILDAPAPPPRTDPWRRTSGMHRVRNRRQLAVVRELWNERDAIARERDVAPGRILPDAAIVEAALGVPQRAKPLAELPGFSGRGARRWLGRWESAITRGVDVAESGLPAQHIPGDGPPPPRLWRERDPAAAVRLTAARAALVSVAEAHELPVENLVSPDAVRRLAWSGPGSAPETPATAVSVAAFLAERGARPWQLGLVAEPLTTALNTPPKPAPETVPDAAVPDAAVPDAAVPDAAVPETVLGAAPDSGGTVAEPAIIPAENEGETVQPPVG